jgi:hypothetical protein
VPLSGLGIKIIPASQNEFRSVSSQMNQALYAHMNNKRKMKKKRSVSSLYIL